jgi:transposase
MIVAASMKQIVAALYGQWSMDGDIFLTFIKEDLVPKLQDGQVVIMDNLTAHKVNGVKQAIEKAGAQLVFLPPYSPDLMPVELLWSKVKILLRGKAVRNYKDFKQVITEIFKRITKKDLSNWFKHILK